MAVNDEGRLPDRTELRASDAERERAAELLREHCAAGRLTAEELDERLEEAYRARTVGELRAVLRELPEESAPDAPGRGEPPGPALRLPRPGLLVVAAAIVAVAAVTGGHGLWLLWPLGFLWLKAGRWHHGHRRLEGGRDPEALPPPARAG